MKDYTYNVDVEWTGNEGVGTSTPKYRRLNRVSTTNKPVISGSAPLEFGGDGQNWSPEELFVAAVSQCHMLTYLFLCAKSGIVVQSYSDRAVGTLQIGGPDGGFFRQIELSPQVVIASSSDREGATRLHAQAHRECFVARSIKTDVVIKAVVTESP